MISLFDRSYGMDPLNYNQIQFLKSANHFSQLPPDDGLEVAFAGRSNAGKSSALNAIARITRLARTSKTPGRTQLINFFSLDPLRRLVDLPGYGYAKVPLAIKQHWERMLTEYLMQRQSLKGVVLVMDIRHPLKDLDWQMMEWILSTERILLHILLTKSDKLKFGAKTNTLLAVQSALKEYEPWVTVQTFSALEKSGVETAQQKLNEWFSDLV
jgi:GTP-binding protein